MDDKFIDPISKDLFIDPVLAEDGYFYEFTQLVRWFKDNINSPITGRYMGKKIIRSFLFTRELNEYRTENNLISYPQNHYTFGEIKL